MKKPLTRLLHNVGSMKSPGQANPQRLKADWWCPGAEARGEEEACAGWGPSGAGEGFGS